MNARVRFALFCLAFGLGLAGCARPSPTTAPTATLRPTLTLTATATLTATPSPTPTSTPSPTPLPTSTPSPTPLPTSTPTATPTPSPTPVQPQPGWQRRPLVAFVSDLARNDDIYILDPATGKVIRVTQSSAEERDPVFSPDGRWLIFRSDAGGSWAFYRVDLQTGEQSRYPGDDDATMAYRGRIDPLPLPGWSGEAVYESYQDGHLNLYSQTMSGRRSPALPAPVYVTDSNGQQVPTGNYAPAVRPGGQQVAYTSWQDGRKAIYLADGYANQLVSSTRLMTNTLDDEYPAWHPDGEKLVFMRWQDHDADLYQFDLATGAQTRLTDSPYPDRSPTFTPDGALFWTRYEPGPPFELHDPFYPGCWRLWVRTPDGETQAVSMPVEGMDVYTPQGGFTFWPAWTIPALPSPAPTPAPEATADLIQLDIACAGGDPRINALLAADYAALRQAVLDASGYDMLGSVSDMFRSLGYGTRNYGHLSWHRTGRTLDILQEWRDTADGRNDLLVTREDLGPQTYWRLYLRTRVQDGTMGEPITASPWIGWFNLDPAQEPQAYAAGGKFDAIPPGYYIDFTRLAGRYGWHRIASYKEADFDWKWDSVGMEFWHYQRADGLTWWQAMQQIYPPELLDALYSWQTCVDKLGLDQTWLELKGIPTPSPVAKSGTQN
ncbi:MAG: PD40 domain-containing protein [Anaerolineae bacterium]|nr:PD40 domain-containing protein [Anaerolineae bacterium]